LTPPACTESCTVSRRPARYKRTRGGCIPPARPDPKQTVTAAGSPAALRAARARSHLREPRRRPNGSTRHDIRPRE
jgi:hypothetical protein